MASASSAFSAADEASWAQILEDFQRIVGYAREGSTVNRDSVSNKMRTHQLCHSILYTNIREKSREFRQRLQNLVENDLRETTATLFETGSECQARTGVEVLCTLGNLWQNHQVVTGWFEKSFKHLETVTASMRNLATIPPQDSLRYMMYNCFATGAYGRVKQSYIEAMLAEIDKARSGAVANCGDVSVGATMLIDLGFGEADVAKLYREDFEKAFLEATRVYYHRASAEVLHQENGRWRFVEWAEQRVAEEARRTAQCLPSITAEPLQKVLERVILKTHLPDLLVDMDCGFEALVVASKAEDQRRMFTLCKRIDGGLAKMAAVLRELICKEGANLNAAFCKGEKDLVSYVEAVMELQVRYEEMLSTRFEKCLVFSTAMKTGFETFINVTMYREVKEDKKVKSFFAEILPTFCDVLLKKEQPSSEQFAAKLDGIMGIFSRISDKQLFEEVYRRQLSKRLLITKTDSDQADHEREILARLQVAMGSAYVSKMTEMINDLENSRKLQGEFLEECRSIQVALGLDLSVQVLRQGCWPSYPVDAMNLPALLSTAYERFRQFYSRKNSGRVLKLVHSLGTLTLIVGFASGQEKELVMTTLQGLVVEQLSHGTSISVADLAVALDVPTELVLRSVTPLVFNLPGQRAGTRSDILRREGEGKGKLTPANVLSMNPSFSCPARKLKMPRPADEGAMQAAQETAGEQKKFLLEAAIVRVMKARKTLELNLLQAEVARQVSSRFSPDFKMVKKLIEGLIQREYLARDEDKANVFNYLA